MVRVAGESFAGVASSFPDVRDGLLYRDDMTNMLLSTFNGGGGAAAVTNLEGEPDAPGIVRLSVSAVAESARIRIHDLSEAQFRPGGGALYIEARLRIATLSDGVNNFAVRAGFGDSANADHVDGIYFECDRNVHGDNAWRACCASNSLRAKSSTGVSPVAGTWTRLRAEVNAPGTQVNFFVDGVQVVGLGVNIPTAAGRGFGYIHHIVKTLGVAARTVDFDYVEVGQTFTTRR